MKASNFIILRAPLQSLALASKKPANLSSMFVNGLRLAAPTFYKEFQKSISPSNKITPKIEKSLHKYWLRSCARCTPYGLFAGYAVVNIDDKPSSIVLDQVKTSNLRSRLDMGYLSVLKSELEHLDIVQSQIKFIRNNSLYELTGEYRYIEYFLEEGNRKYKLSSVEKTDYLEFVLNGAEDYQSLDQLIKRLCTFANIEFEVARDYLIEIKNSQLLISELELSLSGIDPLQNLINKLIKYEGTETIVKSLNEIQDILLNRDEVEIEEVERRVLDCFHVEGKFNDVVQVDLSFSTINNTFESTLVDKILKQAESLQSFARVSPNWPLEDFKRRFIERYEEAEIPLSIVLDDDLGVGYGTNGRSDIDEWIQTIGAASINSPSSFTEDFITKFTYHKYQEFLLDRKSEIVITDDEISKLPKNKYDFGPAGYLFGSLTKIDNDDDFLFHLNGFSNSSAAVMLGRFTLGDSTLTKLVQSTLEIEEAEYPDAIFAEIIHVPQARLGNILLRSALRKYEIPYLGQSGVDKDFQIPISDLTVSVKNKQVVIRSIKHNKRVFPKLSSAHNFNHNNTLPIYRFLCDVQSQGKAQPNVWDWGAFKDENFLPRVRYKNLVLKKAKWKVYESEIKDWPKSTDVKSITKLVKALRKKRNLPKSVLLIQGDNTLLIDFENQDSVDLFVDFIRKFKMIVLEEFLFNNGNCIVSDASGNPYTNEMIIPFKREVDKATVLNISHKSISIQRKFPPGSEWLYLKVYGGKKTLEKILINHIYPFIAELPNDINFQKFFFVRYNDPEQHIRLRFLSDNTSERTELQGELLGILNPFVLSGQIQKILIDTYAREVERYSEELIVTSESIFFNDSLCVLGLNKLLSEVEESSKYKILFSMRGIDFFLNDFNFNLSEKIDILKAMTANFMQEFGGGADLKSYINSKYRNIQKEIFSIMDATQDEKNEIDEAIMFFQKRSQSNETLVLKIKNELIKNENNNRLKSLIGDYIHMFMNRFYLDQQRRYELLIYSFLERFYISKRAIEDKIDKQ
jgi:thiopeptide-type bacteriocin biosynthesis protein